MAVKKGTTGIHFRSSIASNHSISEMATSHICRLKKIREEGDQKSRFSNQEGEGNVIYSECQVVEW